MKAGDVRVQNSGRDVDCTILCRSRSSAVEAMSMCDSSPPPGYVLLMGQIRRRAKGGRARFLTLCFRHTGNKRHPPVTDWKEWDGLLEEAQRVASSSTVE